MNCEMCGHEGVLVRALVEDTELKVCENCAEHGKRMAIVKERAPAAPMLKRQAMLQGIVDDFAARIKTAREKLGKTQKEFAQMIAEKESVIHHLETGSLEPDMELARKLERQLHITLVEQQEDEIIPTKQSKNEAPTLGDFLKK